MSNVAGKACIKNVVTPVRPWLTWIRRPSYMAGCAIPVLIRALRGLGFIHFARWVVQRAKSTRAARNLPSIFGRMA